MNIRYLQDQLEVVYHLREDGSKDAELARLAGLNASVGEINKNLYLTLVRNMPVSEMRSAIELEMQNLITFMFGVASYYDIDIMEQFEEIQATVLSVLEDTNEPSTD